MKKMLLTVAVAIGALLGAQAQQNVEVSVKAGVGATGWIGGDSEMADPIFAYRLGVGLDLPIQGMWGFQTGLNFVGAGASINTAGIADSFKCHQLYLEIPLMATATVNAGNNLDVVFNAGPYVAVGVGGKTKASAFGVSASNKTFADDGFNLRRGDVGFGMGVGFEFNRFLVGVDTRFGFIKLAENANVHNFGVFANVGYKF